MFKKNKKALSEVISTVLLILITVLAVGVLTAFVFPLVKQGTEKSKTCYELRGYLSVESSDYSCYDSQSTSLTIARGFEDKAIAGIIVSLTCKSESKTYTLKDGIEIKDGAVYKVKMYKAGQATETIILLPSPGESKSYQFTEASECKIAKILPVLNSGTTCEPEISDVPACIPAGLS